MSETDSIECQRCGCEVPYGPFCRSCAAINRAVAPSLQVNYGKLTVVGVPIMRASPSGKRRWTVLVRCNKCGKERAILVQNLTSARPTVACKKCRRFPPKHGGSHSQLYGVWQGMLDRCRSQSHSKFKNYGGRGITVCAEWQADFAVFRKWMLANGWEPGLEIDRRNNDGNYEPTNCRIVTHRTNNRNKRRSRIEAAFGESKCIVEWCEDARCVVAPNTVISRLRYGWPFEKALTTPALSRIECGRLSGRRRKSAVEGRA